mmetsp:Transcript_37762/g.88264  ORF Transcript_37762/g.88264 Transcript_37762/m.88264 type:complete len:90 (-) Transcript_37762:54-323(-)
MVATQGLDALVFTGGIGENSGPIRQRILALLQWTGLQEDRERNRINGAESSGVVSVSGTSPVCLVVRTDEELLIARDTESLLFPPTPAL